jgi:UrcA family protein
MNANEPIRNTQPCVCIAAVAVCAVLSGPAAQANDHVVTIRLPVATAGLDLRQPAAARELYGRLKEAARTVCGSGDRVGLEPVTDFSSCYEKALGNAIRSVNRRELTMAYLKTHTLQDAATQGIDVPTLVAAK